ncbi:MAG: ubiquinone biosynthesis protein COQ7 [Tissierellia bacterium]|nr:ubiquinone biosynthesis protein COQ7 [Tissierellia bacterium]
MASFGNPFGANVPRKLTKDELIQAIRLDIAGELEAIYVYDAHIQATDDPVTKRVLGDIRDEEKAHIGELLTLLKYLDPKEAEFLAEGEEEVREMLAELNIQANPTPATSDNEKASTVGSLLDE